MYIAVLSVSCPASLIATSPCSPHQHIIREVLLDQAHVVWLQLLHTQLLIRLTVQVTLLECLQPRHHAPVFIIQQMAISIMLVECIEGVVADTEQGLRRQEGAIVSEDLQDDQHTSHEYAAEATTTTASIPYTKRHMLMKKEMLSHTTPYQ